MTKPEVDVGPLLPRRWRLTLAVVMLAAALWVAGEPHWAARVAVLVVVAWVGSRSWRAWTSARVSPATPQPPPPEPPPSQLPRNADRPAGAGVDRFAIGLAGHGQVWWELDRCPHMLVAGETGSGKTNLIRGIAHDAAVAGCEVRIVDPKRIEMLGLRGMAGVTVATSTRDMVDLVRLTFADMDARYEALEGGADVADLPRLLLVVDEVREWVRRANALWLEQDRADLGIKTGTEHRAVGELASIAAMGRSGRVHLLAGIQRPDAKALGSDGGSMRDNYRARIALGSLSQEGALMMFGGADWGRDVADIPGRGTVSLGGAPFEVQTYRCVESSSNVLTSVATRGRLQT